MLPFGRWNSLRNESSGSRARISVNAFPIPKIEAIYTMLYDKTYKASKLLDKFASTKRSTSTIWAKRASTY
jgi:hypothetical protein